MHPGRITKSMNHTNRKYLFWGFALTLIQFSFAYAVWGFYFEGYEAYTNFVTKGVIIDPNTPILANAHFWVLSYIFKIQQYFPRLPIYGIYHILSVFTAVYLINFYFLSKFKSISTSNKILIHSILFLILFEHIVQINNIRTCILLLIAFSLLSLTQIGSKINLYKTLPILILACVVRIELGFIFGLLTLGFWYIYKSVNFNRGLIIFIITSFFFAVFQYQNAHSDIYLKTAFNFEREFHDKNNFKKIPDSPEYEDKRVLQRVIALSIEDKDVISPEDYNAQIMHTGFLEYLYSFEFKEKVYRDFELNINYLKSNHYWLLLLVIMLCLSTALRKKDLWFSCLLMMVVPLIMTSAILQPRFLFPFFTSLIILLLSKSHKIFNSRKWLITILCVYFSSLLFIRTMNKIHKEYEFVHTKSELMVQKIFEANQEGKAVVMSHLPIHPIFSPRLFHVLNYDMKFYLLSSSFSTYHETFKQVNRNFFKNSASLLSNIQDISSNPNIVFVSNNQFMDLISQYLYFYHQIRLTYTEYEEFADDFSQFEIKLEKK